MTWPSDLSASSADLTMSWAMSLCSFPIAMASVGKHGASVRADRSARRHAPTYRTFGALRHRDHAVREVHEHVKQVRSVAHVRIHESRYVPCGDQNRRAREYRSVPCSRLCVLPASLPSLAFSYVFAQLVATVLLILTKQLILACFVHFSHCFVNFSLCFAILAVLLILYYLFCLFLSGNL